MPKGKYSEHDSLVRGLILSVCCVCGVVQAQSPTLQDVVDAAKQAKLQEYSKSLSDAYKQPSLPEPNIPKPVNKPADLLVTPPVPSAPVLRAIYGVNRVLEAELVLDGASYSVFSDDVRIEVGPWVFGYVFLDGVMLLRAPLNTNQINVVDSMSDEGKGRLISCARFGLKRGTCLVLLTGKANSGMNPPVISSPVRGSSASAGPLPPLPMPR